MMCGAVCSSYCFFFFNDTATTEIYTPFPTRRSSDLFCFVYLFQLNRCLLHDKFRIESPKDRKSTRLSSHGYISYAVFCLKKKNKRLNSSHGYISYSVFCLTNKQANTIT